MGDQSSWCRHIQIQVHRVIWEEHCNGRYPNGENLNSKANTGNDNAMLHHIKGRLWQPPLLPRFGTQWSQIRSLAWSGGVHNLQISSFIIWLHWQNWPCQNLVAIKLVPLIIINWFSQGLVKNLATIPTHNIISGMLCNTYCNFPSYMCTMFDSR